MARKLFDCLKYLNEDDTMRWKKKNQRGQIYLERQGNFEIPPYSIHPGEKAQDDDA